MSLFDLFRLEKMTTVATIIGGIFLILMFGIALFGFVEDHYLNKYRYSIPHVINFKTTISAEQFLNKINSILKNYGYVTISDVAVILKAKVHTKDGTYGWTDFSAAHIQTDYVGNFGGHYYISLQVPQIIDKEKIREEQINGR